MDPILVQLDFGGFFEGIYAHGGERRVFTPRSNCIGSDVEFVLMGEGSLRAVLRNEQSRGLGTPSFGRAPVSSEAERPGYFGSNPSNGRPPMIADRTTLIFQLREA